MSAVLEQAQFESVEAALRFAFRQNRENFQAPMLNRMAAASSEGSGLGGLDGAGMAGIILRHVQSQGHTAAAILCARYTPREIRCECGRSCCKGYKTSEFWQDRVAIVTQAIRGAVTGLSNYRYVYGATSKYFRVKVNLGDLADLCQVPARVAEEHNHKIKQFLQKAEGAAFHAISGSLRDAGIVL